MRSLLWVSVFVLGCAGRATDGQGSSAALQTTASGQVGEPGVGGGQSGGAAGAFVSQSVDVAAAGAGGMLDASAPPGEPEESLSADGTVVGSLDGGATAPDRGTGDLTVLVIADLSGSMATPWQTDSRWLTASNTLMEQLEPLADWLTIGAIFFPVDDECGVTELREAPQIPFTTGANFMAAWRDTAVNWSPAGNTPLGRAFRVADAAIQQAESEGRLEQRFRVVVLTDGEPNCDTQPGELEQFAAAWYEMGVETLILGLPGSHAAEALLNRVALAGGTGEVDEQESEEELQGSVGAALR